MEFIGAFFVLLLGVGAWFILWSLIKDPETPFTLDGVAPHHGIDPEESLDRVRMLFNIEPYVTLDDVEALLSVSPEEAYIYLEHLVEEGEIEESEREGIEIYVRRQAY